MATVDHALIHRARLVTWPASGVRDVQGERPPAGVPVYGPWFPCRRMTQRQAAEQADDPGQRKRRETTYVLMWGEVHEDGTPIVAPVPADAVEVEAYGVATLWQVADEPLTFDSGSHVFGGQAEIARAGDSR